MLSTIVILSAITLHAGPIPKSDEVIRKTVETAWNELKTSPDDRTRRKAYLTLSRHPKETTTLLAAKLQPLELSQETALAKLKDLDSDDPAVWQKAVDFLTEFDIRLAMDLKTAFETCKTRLAMQRLGASVLEIPTIDCENQFFAVVHEPSIVVIKTGFAQGNGFSQVHHRQSLKATDLDKRVWLQRELGISVLQSFKSKESKDVLHMLARPTIQSPPTKMAGITSNTSQVKLKTPIVFDFYQYGNWQHYEPYQIMLEYLCRPIESMEAIRQTVSSVQLTQEKAVRLMNELDYDDKTICLIAFEKWKNLDLQLITNNVESWLSTYGTKRSRERYWSAQTGRSEIDALNDMLIQYETTEQTASIRVFQNQFSSHLFQYDRVARQRISHPTWFRIAVAIDLLEAWDTKESVALLTSLATGHPRAAPTIDARAALKRLNQPLPAMAAE